MRAILFLWLTFHITLLSAQQGWRQGEMEVMIHDLSGIQLKGLLEKGLNFDPAARDGRVARAYLTQDELDQLIHEGYSCTITIPDLNSHYLNFWDNPAVPPGYYTYQQIIDIADSLAQHFPSICKKILTGTSYGGRQLAVLKISDNVNTDENEAEIMFDGGIHGDEVGASENVIRYARDLCRWYGNNPEYTYLIDNREIFLYLMVNPDGRVSMSRYNQNMVDINRDGGYMWDGEGNSPAAYSQLETKALRNFIYDNQFVVYTNFHSGIEIVSYPWSYRPDATSDHNHIDYLASVYASSSGYASLTYGQGYNIMYPINGSMKDIAYGVTGNVGWSMEISESKQPPQSQIQMYYSYNVPAMTEMIRRAGYGAEGVVTDSVTGQPVRAIVWVNDYYPVYTDPVTGDYHKYLLPGTYTVKVTASGYKSKTISGRIVPATGSVVTDFQLQPDTTWYGYRVISCQIPNNNFGDEGYTPGCIGAPDNVAYSLGRNGWIIVDMGDTLFNGPGNDIKVIQAGSTPENFQLLAGNSMDGPWNVIGTGTGTTEFDLGLISKARYLRIKDMSSGPITGQDVGYDLDAIQMLTPPIKVSFTASETNPCQHSAVDFSDLSAGNGVEWSWQFPGGDPSTSNAQHPQGILYEEPGVYSVSLTVSNGVSSSAKLQENYIVVRTTPEVELGNDTVVCMWAQVTLDAGNPGMQYLWSTGATTQTITVDSTGTGIGSTTVSVEVFALNGCTGKDTTIITFDPCTRIDPGSYADDPVIWPNPSTGTINVQHGFKGNATIILTSITGKEILRQSYADIPAVIEITSKPISGGLYFLKIENDTRAAVRKIIFR